MQERHKNKLQYFKEQAKTTEKYVIPYIEDVLKLTPEVSILEIGCGEGGNLLPFIEAKCEEVGIDLNERKIEKAKIYTKELVPESTAQFICQNIYDVNSKDIGEFDLIIMRDVIEHIPDQEKFLGHLKGFLKPSGKVFFGFPPWRMPFGGHQQVCVSKVLSKVPYFHLLPNPIYKSILSIFGEPKSKINSLMDIKKTGISINRFLSIVKKNNYDIAKKTFYLFNPNYEAKFGLTPRVQFSAVSAIPHFRDFLTTCLYCIIELPENKNSKN